MLFLPTLIFCLGMSVQWCSLGGVGEEALEGGFQGAFVGDALVLVRLQGLVIFLDRLVGRFDRRRCGHEWPNLAGE